MEQLRSHLEQARTHFDTTIAGIRTGRANPALVEHLEVECYGSRSPIVQLAAISAPEPRLLVIQPWDPAVIQDIEKALSQSSLGIYPVVDGKLIRLPFPAMTEERRKELQKVLQEMVEAARVRMRAAREEAVRKARVDQKDGRLSEDELALQLKAIQRELDQAIAGVEQAAAKKSEELATI